MIDFTKLTSDKPIFFTSDTHFNHANIIKFCGRPYESVEEMNKDIIERWNNKVPENGIVFHLGDFAFGGSDIWNNTRKRLNGTVYLIEGNHDIKQNGQTKYNLFEGVFKQLVIKIDCQFILLNHYPFLCYASRERGTWQLFGHVHSGPNSNKGIDVPRLQYLYPTQYDVGVDNNNFTPISYSEVREKIIKQCTSTE